MSRCNLIKTLFTPILLLIITGSLAQCPDNIGFEKGSFQNWVIYDGKISSANGAILTDVVDSSNRVTILKNTYPQTVDPFGEFPVNSPNGSNYSIKLGDTSGMWHAQTVSYTFTIPANQDNYSIIYNYAVVLQNSDHADWAQPGFTSKVFDVSANHYIDCGAFNFVASANLPGFQLSSKGKDIYYKSWSPITIKLTGYAGKTVRIEFTSHDCAYGPHFGYAYIDINENCASPVSGNVYCNNTNSVSLTAPFGFSSYTWYNADYSKIVGTSNILKLNPHPPSGSLFHVVVTPYPGLGCLDTLHTTMQLSPQTFQLQTVDSIVGCNSNLVDLTAPFITAGSSPGLTFSYFTDTSQTNYMPTPKQVNTAGIYFIKAVNNAGCSELKPVTILFTKPPNVVVNNPVPVCFPNKIDLTDTSLTAGSDAGLVYTYWKDSVATNILPNPQLIGATATYYIKAATSVSCFVVKPVYVTVSKSPLLTVANQASCGFVNITSPIGFTSNETDVKTSFWQDSTTTIKLSAPDSIKISGTYYIKVTNSVGCSVIAAIEATILPLPYFTISQSPVVFLPATIDLTALVKSTTNTNSSFTYWQDSAATISVIDPTKVSSSAMYYIKSTSADGCIVFNAVEIIIKAPPIIPANAFSPNNDGINDTWEIPLLRYFPNCSVEVFSRSGQLVFRSIGYNKNWDGTFNNRILPIGNYYYIIKTSAAANPLSGSVLLIR